MKNRTKVTIFTNVPDIPVSHRKKGPIRLNKSSSDAAAIPEVGGREVPIDTVRSNLLAFAGLLETLVPKLKMEKNGFSLKSFDVEVGIDGKGKVGFLGTGAEVGGNAAFTLRFER